MSVTTSLYYQSSNHCTQVITSHSPNSLELTNLVDKRSNPISSIVNLEEQCSKSDGSQNEPGLNQLDL